MTEVLTGLDWQIKTLRSRVMNNQHKVFAVVGADGLGKSFTVQTMLQQLPWAVLSVPATESLTALLGRLTVLNPEAIQWTAETVNTLESGQDLPNHQVLPLLQTQLMALAPIAIHLENIENVQPWLAFIRTAQSIRGVTVVATSRHSLPAVFSEIRLAYFNQSQIQALLEQHGYVLPTQAITWLYARANGNPRYTLEFCLQLCQIGALRNDAGQWVWSEPQQIIVPLGLQSEMTEQLEVLVAQVSDPQKAKMVLLTRALVTTEVLANQYLPAFIGIQIQAELEKVTLKQQLGNKNGFYNPLFNDLLRQDVWQTERRLIARTLLEPVGAKQPKAAIQLIQAAQLEPSAELAAWQLIAEQAMQLQMLSVAGECYIAAMELCTGTLQADFALKASRCVRLSNRAKSLQLINHAMSIAPNNETYQLERCKALLANGQLEPLQAFLQTKDQQNPAWLELHLQTLFRSGQDQKALDLWQENLLLQPLLCETTHQQVATGFLRMGQQKQAFIILEQKKSVARDVITAVGLRQIGQLNAALTLLKQTLETDMAKLQLESVLHQRALVHQELGNLPAAMHDAENALEILQICGDEFRIAARKNTLAGILIERAEFVIAEQLLLEARRIIEHFGYSQQLVCIERNLAWLYLEWQPEMGGALAVKHARNALRHARTICGVTELHEHLVFIAWAEALHGNPKTALQLILETPRSSAFSQWVHLLCLENTGQKNMAQLFKTWLRDQPYSTRRTRFALELQRLTKTTKTLPHEMTENPLTLFIAKRYFPTLNQTNLTANTHKLEVLGTLKVNGIIMSGRLRRAKDILLLLLEARIMGKPEVTLLELMDVLYPNEDEIQASSAIRQLIYRLRKTYGDNVITRSLHGYSLGILSDVEEFLATNNTLLWQGLYQFRADSDSSVSTAIHQHLEKCIENLRHHNPSEAARVQRFIPRMYLKTTKNTDLLVLEA